MYQKYFLYIVFELFMNSFRSRLRWTATLLTIPLKTHDQAFVLYCLSCQQVEGRPQAELSSLLIYNLLIYCENSCYNESRCSHLVCLPFGSCWRVLCKAICHTAHIQNQWKRIALANFPTVLDLQSSLASMFTTQGSV